MDGAVPEESVDDPTHVGSPHGGGARETHEHRLPANQPKPADRRGAAEREEEDAPSPAQRGRPTNAAHAGDLGLRDDAAAAGDPGPREGGALP